MKKNKKVLSIASSLIISLMMSQAIDAKVGDWIGVGGNESNSKTIYSKTAKKKEDIEKLILNKNDKGETIYFKDIIIVDDLIYGVATSSIMGGEATLYAFDYDGNQKKAIALSAKADFYSRLTYDGENSVFVNLQNQVEAIDIKNNQLLWHSESDIRKQMLSQLVYHDGYLYGGSATRANASNTPSDGFYFAIDTKNGKTTNGVKEYAWTWGKDDSVAKGFYWDGAVVYKDKLVFAGDAGTIVLHDLKTDRIYDIRNFNNLYSSEENIKTHKVRSLINYDKKNDKLIIGTQDSAKLFRLGINNDKFDFNNIEKIDAPDQISGGIANSGKFIYAPSGGNFGHSFSVLDENLNIKHSTKTYGTQSYPLVNQSEDNDFLYFLDFVSGKIMLAENDGSGQLKYKELENLGAGYSTGNVIANNRGDLILSKNDGGPIIILKNKQGDYNQSELEQLINKLPSNPDYYDNEQLEFVNKKVDEFKGKLNNEQTLLDINDKYNKLSQAKINALITKINEIPSDFNDLKTAENILKLNLEYSELTFDDQAKVSNADKLKQALTKVYENNLFNPIQTFESMMYKIDNLETFTLDQKHIVVENRAYYEGLSASEKQQVKNLLTKLEQAETRVIELEKAQEQAETWNDKLSKLPSKDKIDLTNFQEYKPILDEYLALNVDIKSFINKDNLDKINQIEKKIDNLVAILPVIEILEQLKTPEDIKTNEDIDKAFKVYKTYKDLSYDQRMLFTNEQTDLVNALNNKATIELKNLIANLPSVGDLQVEHKNELDTVNKIYNEAHSDSIKSLGEESISKLNSLNERMQVLLGEQSTSNKEAAQVIIDLINKLPEVNKLSLNDKVKVNEAKQAYDNASNEVKALINSTLVTKLNNSLNKIKDLEVAVVKPKPLPKNKTVKNGNTTNYYILNKNNKYDLVKQVIVAGKKTTTKEYKIINGKNYLAKQVIKQGNKVETKQYKVIKNSYKLIKHTKVDNYKSKNITIYDSTYSYYANGKIKLSTIIKRDLKTNKIMSKQKFNYKDNGKKTKYIIMNYKNSKITKRTEYVYNKSGVLKSDKQGKAYRYLTSYNKKGKAIKTIRTQYNSKGKLSNYYYIVKTRTNF